MYSNQQHQQNTAAAIMPFTHEQFGQVRVIRDENTGEPWFVAKDVAEALGYAWNGTACIAHIPDQWRKVRSALTSRGIKEMPTLSQQGLYFFLGRSDKPKALPYQMWIADEVVPSIMKTGGYIAATPDDSPESILARAVLVAQDTIKRIETEKKEAEARLAIAEPKAQVTDSLFAKRSGQGMKVYELARKHDGVNSVRIKRDLMRLGYLYHRAQQYRVYSRYSGAEGFFFEKEDHKYQKHEIYATAKGAVLITQLYREGKLTMKSGCVPCTF